MTLFDLLMGFFLWIAYGHAVCLSAILWMDKRPTMSKLVVGLLAGPFALNKEWWKGGSDGR